MNLQVISNEITPPLQNKDKPKCINCAFSEIITWSTKEDGIIWHCYKQKTSVTGNYYCPKHQYSDK